MSAAFTPTLDLHFAFSRLFEAYVMALMTEMPVAVAARIVVIFATEGKGSAGLLTFNQFLTQLGIDPNQIRESCCDLSAAFIAGVEEHVPAAQITFDKFHVMKLVNEAVDEVRREEQKEVVELKKTRFVWLKNESNLTEARSKRCSN